MTDDTPATGQMPAAAAAPAGSPNPGGYDAAQAERQKKLAEAVSRLDDAVDTDWNADGSPNMAAVERLFGDTSPTRAEVDAIGRKRAPSVPDTPPAPASVPPSTTAPGTMMSTAPPPAPTLSPGRIVFLSLADALDGDYTVVGIVVRINADGSANIRALAPNAGADRTYTGVLPTEYVANMADGADKNAALAATWDWPPRV
jgi:hypothetical protein